MQTKSQMSYIELENRIRTAEKDGMKSDALFASGLFKACDAPAATIKRTDFSHSSLSKGIAFGKRLYLLRVSDEANMFREMDSSVNGAGRSCRIRLFFNSHKIYAVDTEDGASLSCSRNDLHSHAEFFFPAIGRERESVSAQQKLDANIGDKIAGLSNELKMINPGTPMKSIYSVITSVILMLIMDAYYGLINSGKTMESYLDTHTKPDGSDMFTVLKSIMHAMNGTSPSSAVKELDARLFASPIPVLQFSRKGRQILLELSNLNWAEVKSYVPGAILQSLTAENQTSLTDNYLSRKNVLRLIGPLFINDIRRKAENVHSVEDFKSFLDEINRIYILNPDSSSGDCLIGCLDELNTATEAAAVASGGIPVLFPLDHILGIEPDPTAADISRISLCLSMLSWSKRFGKTIDAKTATDILYTDRIVNARSLSVDWEKAFSPDGKIYILGNTQYVGARMRSEEQTAECDRVFAGLKNYRDIDYSGAYIYKAAKYMRTHDAEASFIVTNSLTQGSQAGTLWPFVFDLGMHISFGWQSFKLQNLSKRLTTVTVVVVGIAKDSSDKERTLFVRTGANDFEPTHPTSISPYLVPGEKIIVKRRFPIGVGFPRMVKGNMPYTKHLILSAEEKNMLLDSYPKAAKYIRYCKGSEEVLNGGERYCLYIRDEDKDDAMSIPPIKERVDLVRLERANNKDSSARKLALRPWAFREDNQTMTQSIVIPAVSSENYAYIPVDIVGPETIVTNLAFVIYDTDEWILGVLMSRMHNVWIKTVCGGLETRIRYSNVLGYNTFPFPDITEAKKAQIRNCVSDIYIAREQMIGMTLAQKYKKGCMSKDLEMAHQRLDMIIDGCYQAEPFADDEARLYKLFEMYEEATVKN
jgi:hypothetical protein